MAVPKTVCRAILIKDKHLRLEGDETADDLRTAIEYLKLHKCVPYPGIPVDVSLATHFALGTRIGRYPNAPNAVR